MLDDAQAVRQNLKRVATASRQQSYERHLLAAELFGICQADSFN